ncbi:DMP19 family protein [Microbacterium gorillae]|uniref:DMP19 family protein n=1 Tax=Microbacterium gorillae TaxID=1231063 RepID=UPI003D98BFB3
MGNSELRGELESRLSVFERDLRQGGFAQVLFNARGEGLADIEDMLIAVGAPRAQAYYVRAIRLALDDKTGYRAFLADWHAADGRPLRDELQLLSIEYLMSEPSLAAESRAWREAF